MNAEQDLVYEIRNPSNIENLYRLFFSCYNILCLIVKSVSENLRLLFHLTKYKILPPILERPFYWTLCVLLFDCKKKEAY